ncbi:hypothetical protein ACTMU2_20310 [Cupriavidus basilensis]
MLELLAEHQETGLTLQDLAARAEIDRHHGAPHGTLPRGRRLCRARAGRQAPAPGHDGHVAGPARDEPPAPGSVLVTKMKALARLTGDARSF